MLDNNATEDYLGVTRYPSLTAVMGQIDLVEAAESHMQWRSKLKKHINGEVMETWLPSSAGMDDWCGLGRWLNGPGETLFGNLSVFRRLRGEHAEFHRLAALILTKVQEGSLLEAEALLNQEFSQSQRRILVALTELNEVMRDMNGGMLS